VRGRGDGSAACVAGLAEVRKLNVAWIRLAFVLLTLLGGLGVLIYVSCWLIAQEQGDEARAAGPSGIVVLAQAGYPPRARL